MRTRKVLALVVSVVTCMLVPSLGSASAPKSGRLDLKDEYDLKIEGGTERAVPAGDVNGDGVPDVLVSVGGVAREPEAGRSWVVFGRPDGGTINVNALGTGGFMIEGAADQDYASMIAAPGDVNGDGLDDVLIGASGADHHERLESGSAYVIFGKTDPAPVHLAAFNEFDDQGFRIDGPSKFGIFGQDVGWVGDVDNDGLADLLVGAPFLGRTYVVYGKTGTDPVDLASLGEDEYRSGYYIQTPVPSRDNGYAVSGVGDVNADGHPDFAVGVSRRRYSSKGTVAVVFASRSPMPLDMANLGDRGFKISGVERGSYSGYSIATAGDANGDGLSDIAIGAPAINGYDPSGDAFVVFGKKGRKGVSLDALGYRGYRIEGRDDPTGDSLGVNISPAGDYNGDGRDDIIVGGPGATFGNRREAGGAFIIFGRKRSSHLTIDELGNRGIFVMGPDSETFAGRNVGGDFDMNLDGLPDIMVSESDSSVYVIWRRP